MFKIAPSILNADLTCLGNQVNQLMESGIEWIHVDVMDGHFVPNITFGPMVVEAVRQLTDATIDVHLMIENPDHFLGSFVEAGADRLTVHYESCRHLWRTIDIIHQLGAKAGVTVNPATPITLLDPVLHLVDLVLVLSVEPGFGGQEFLPYSLQKIAYLADQRKKQDLGFLIEVDGGINQHTAPMVVQQGADVLVIGTSIFKSGDIKKAIAELQTAQNPVTSK